MRRSQVRPQSTMWIVPSIYAVSAVAAGALLPRLENRLWPDLGAGLSSATATALYSAIASGMMALTAIVFSLTFLMIQFGATAYSPRLVLWLARDPVLAHALGMFTATFLYAVSALAWVDRGGVQRVPLLSAWMVVALLLGSIAMFIALLQRVALLQIHRMLSFIGDRGRDVIATLYSAPPESRRGTDLPARVKPTQILRHVGRPSSVQAIHVVPLAGEARAANGTIEVLVAVGDSVIESTPILRVFGADRLIDVGSLSHSIERGQERTFAQDPKYAIRLLVDIAIRALSPAVNDPTTAVQALDQISDLLRRLGCQHLEVGEFHDGEGHLRVTIPFPTWDDFLRLAFEEIRAYGSTSVQVMRRMKALIADLTPLVPEERRPALAGWLARLDRTVVHAFPDPDEQAEASVGDRQGLGVSRRSVA